MNSVATDFTPREQMILAIVPKFTASLSLIGSGWIIMEVLRDRKKIGLVYHRLMLGMSIGDCILSAGLFLSTWPMPADTPGVYGAVGTTATCTAQGFFIQLGWVSEIYNAYLAVYHVLVLRYNWSERRIRTQLEPLAIAFYVVIGVLVGIVCIPLKLFNNANLWCWISSLPLGCTGEGDAHGGQVEVPCVRGAHAWLYRLLFWYVWLWLAMAVVVVSMVLIYWTVHQQANRAKKYGNGGGWLEKNRRNVAKQAIYYTLTFISICLFGTMTRVMQIATGETKFPLALCFVIFTPTNGIWNGLIYLRPRYMSYREKHPEWRKTYVIQRVLFRSARVARARVSGNIESLEEEDDDYKLGTVKSVEPRPSSPHRGPPCSKKEFASENSSLRDTQLIENSIASIALQNLSGSSARLQNTSLQNSNASIGEQQPNSVTFRCQDLPAAADADAGLEQSHVAVTGDSDVERTSSSSSSVGISSSQKSTPPLVEQTPVVPAAAVGPLLNCDPTVDLIVKDSHKPPDGRAVDAGVRSSVFSLDQLQKHTATVPDKSSSPLTSDASSSIRGRAAISWKGRPSMPSKVASLPGFGGRDDTLLEAPIPAKAASFLGLNEGSATSSEPGERQPSNNVNRKSLSVSLGDGGDDVGGGDDTLLEAPMPTKAASFLGPNEESATSSEPRERQPSSNAIRKSLSVSLGDGVDDVGGGDGTLLEAPMPGKAASFLGPNEESATSSEPGERQSNNNAIRKSLRVSFGDGGDDVEGVGDTLLKATMPAKEASFLGLNEDSATSSEPRERQPSNNVIRKSLRVSFGDGGDDVDVRRPVSSEPPTELGQHQRIGCEQQNVPRVYWSRSA